MFAFLKKHWFALAAWLLLILPLAIFLLVSALIMAYMYWPKSFDEINTAQLKTDGKHITVLAHGLRGGLSTWINPLRELYEEKHHPGTVVGIDWSPYAQSSLTCAVNGKRIGNQVGAQLASNQSINTVHLIGHSCGAFVIYGACQAIKEADLDIVVQTTYLDPVSIYGISRNYGLEHFGTCADYSEAYIDTEDGFAGSDQLIPNTHTYDVTQVRRQSGSEIPPHVWPTVYYRRLWKAVTRRRSGRIKR